MTGIILEKQRKYDSVYLTIVSGVGLSLIVWGLIQFPTYEQPLNFVLLLLLAAIAEVAATLTAVEGDKIAYEVGTAIGLGAVPFYGPAAATVIVMASGLAFWLYKTQGTPFSQRNWQQLAFNIGMHSVAIFVAGTVFLMVETADSLPGVRTIFAWLLAAVIYDQINLWLLIIMLRLRHGPKLRPFAFWMDNRWAMAVNISVLTIGGALLASAVAEFQWIGIIIFFFPILLSALSFRLYISKVKVHMDNLENIIEQRTKELSEVVREKDAFLAVLTHDMKTPLTTIGLYTEIMIQQPDILLKKPNIPQVIRRSQRSLIEIVNNILDLEKLQVGGTLNLEKAPFDLIQSLEYLVESLSSQAEKKGITIEHSFAAPTIVLAGDQQQLERAFQNLLSNAIKYTPDGGHVCIELLVEEDEAQIYFRDTGYGIPAEDLPDIFDRFHRVAKHEKLAIGTGLGLAIVKAIVETHQGEISVTSEEDKGSTFLVRLPL